MTKGAIFIILSVILIPPKLYAQCPTVDFIVSNPPFCIDEQLEIQNNTLDGISYEWDFCSGEVGGALTGEIFQDDIQFKSSFNVDIVKDNNLYYGFTISRQSRKLFRFDFGDNLYGEPTVTDLGNLSLNMSQKLSIKVLKEGENWYGLISEYSPGELVLIDFGNDLKSTPTIKTIFNELGLNESTDLDYTYFNGELIVFITNSTGLKLARLNFGNSILNTPSITNINITGGNKIVGFSLIKNCESWYGLISSRGNNKILKIEFGTSLLNNSPILSDITGATGISFDTPTGLEIVSENSNYYAFIQSGGGGNLYRLDFGLDMSGSVNGYDLGNLGVLGSNWGFSIFNDNSTWIGFSSENTGERISKIIFNTNCPSLISSSTDNVPTTKYTQEGTYNITLKAKGVDESINYLTKQITISPSLAPQPSALITGNCLASPISFDGQQISGDITTWNWDFGDGAGTSIFQNADYTYAAAGLYPVKLDVTDANGCHNLLIDTVQVYEESVPNFSLPIGSLCMNNEVAFNNTSTGETGPAVTWTWDFNGEGASSEKEPSFTFLTPGSKTITLTSSIPGCANVTQQTITIEEAPTTAFSFNNTCNGATNTFTDATTGSNLTAWNWDFGDGTNSTTQSPTHTYTNPGKYVVTLIVGNNLGCTTTKVDTVYNHSIPVTNFTHDLPCSTTPIQFTDQSLVDNANIIAWEWDFGDGESSTEQHPTHLYGQIGDFDVQLKAFSQYGCFSINQQTVTVAQGPEVDFTWDKSCEGEAITFTDLTNSFGIAITNWTWIIDGKLATSPNPTHTFTNAGTNTVQLTVAINNLCTQTLTQDIIIEVPPTVQFGYNEGCGGSGTEFYDLTSQTGDPITAREWRVDGAIFSSDSVATAPLAPGNYDITLSVITNAGCVETSTSTVSLIGSPIADYEVNTNYGATNLQVDFTNLSTGGSNYLWSFGDADNTTSTERNPSFIFTTVGEFNVTLRTSSKPDCYSEQVQTITIVEPQTNAHLIAITPIIEEEKTTFRLTIENTGTTVLDNTSNLVFRADYNTEVIEPLNAIIYAGKTINYTPAYAIAQLSNPNNLCVELISSNANILDEACIAIASSVIISASYPNPSKGTATIDVILEKDQMITVRAMNREGQVMYNKSTEGQAGLNKVSIEATQMPQGLYIIEITTDGKTEKRKLSIVR